MRKAATTLQAAGRVHRMRDFSNRRPMSLTSEVSNDQSATVTNHGQQAQRTPGALSFGDASAHRRMKTLKVTFFPEKKLLFDF